MSLLPFPFVDSIDRHYELDRIFDFLGNGSFASVYRARRRDDPSQVVALKVLSKSDATTERACRDIVNEVAILRQVRHPHCVRLLDAFQTHSEVCLVLAFVEGRELFETLAALRGVLPEMRAAVLVRQLLSALAYLHDELRVVHRDLKPENLILTLANPNSPQTSEMVLTVVDFGLAKFFGRGLPGAVGRRMRPGLVSASSLQAAGGGGNGSGHFGSSGSQQSRLLARLQQQPQPPLLQQPAHAAISAAAGPALHLAQGPRSASMDSVDSYGIDSPILATPCGTLRYAAPEIVRGLGQLVPLQTTRGSLPKLDVYSVGIVAHVVLSGHLPFSTKNKATLAAEMERGPTFDGARWAAVSAEAIDLVRALLSPEPSKRPTASEALRHPWLRAAASPQHSPPQLSLTAIAITHASCSSSSCCHNSGTVLPATAATSVDESAPPNQPPTLAPPPPLLLLQPLLPLPQQQQQEDEEPPTAVYDDIVGQRALVNSAFVAMLPNYSSGGGGGAIGFSIDESAPGPPSLPTSGTAVLMPPHGGGRCVNVRFGQAPPSFALQSPPPFASAVLPAAANPPPTVSYFTSAALMGHPHTRST